MPYELVCCHLKSPIGTRLPTMRDNYLLLLFSVTSCSMVPAAWHAAAAGSRQQLQQKELFSDIITACKQSAIEMDITSSHDFPKPKY